MKFLVDFLRLWYRYLPIQDDQRIHLLSYFGSLQSWIHNQDWLFALLLVKTFDIVHVAGIYLITSMIPLYGISRIISRRRYSYFWPRVILGSYRGTILEFGVAHIVIAKVLMRCMDYYIEQRARSGTLFEYYLEQDYYKPVAALTFFGTLVSLIAAIVSLFRGLFGNRRHIGIVGCIAIITQLVVVGYAHILLHIISPKAFATTLGETILYRAFSPALVNTGRGSEYEGAVCALFHLLNTRQDKMRGLREAFYRQNLPNLTNLLVSFSIFSCITYFRIRSVGGVLKALIFQFIFFGIIQLVLNGFEYNFNNLSTKYVSVCIFTPN